MRRTARHPRSRNAKQHVDALGPSARVVCDGLESRLALCLAHLGAVEPPVELLPGFTPTAQQPYVGPASSGLESDPEPAQIVWANRNNGDRFDDVFGANAEAARRVVDQVVIDFARLIGSFNYPTSNTKFQLYVAMGSPGQNGLGASATLFSLLGGKPNAAEINIQRGLDGLGGGFFVDPTPGEHSEFLGSIQNPFCGDAPVTSPAYGLADLYTLVALELTHGLGLFGNYAPGWSSRTRPTGIAELGEGYNSATGFSVGEFWVFEGPSIKHLLTSNNGGRSGSDFGQAVHSAGHANAAGPVFVNFDGQQWATSNDIGNAVYERSRRYLPNYAFSLMFKDAFGFSSVNPAIYNSFHATRTSTGEVVVRLPTAASADTLSLNVTPAGKLVVSYDLGIDAPASGALPGAGDLPAWVTEFDAAAVTSIRIETGDGADTISIANLGAIPTTLDSGAGADSLTIAGSTNVTLLGNQDLAAIAIDAGAALKLQQGVNATVLTTGGLSGAGTFDLGDGVLIDRSANSVTQLRSRLLAGFNGGAWDGAAASIRSTLVGASAERDTLGLGIASRIVPATLGGFALQPADRVVRYTLAGDANFDRVVNFDDLLRLASSYNLPGGAIASEGEFSYDAAGAVDFDDLLVLAANYNASLPATLGGLSLQGGPVGGTLADEGDDAPTLAGDVLA